MELADACPPSQPVPNLLLSAVHYLLLTGVNDPLRRYYPSLSVEAESPESAFPAFRKFSQVHAEKILPLLEERLVQTNEVGRCAYLYPSMLTLSAMFPERPIHLIELGSSAGLNLLWDHYRYQYGEDEPVGLMASALTVNSSWRGEKRPDFSLPTPKISRRTGVDLNPIDLMNQDQITWLQALVWPEQFERRSRLTKAVRIAMVNPVEMVTGDAVEELPGLLSAVAPTDVAVVYHTHFINQLSDDSRARLLATVQEVGSKRDLIHIHNNIEPHLHATVFRSGERIEVPLAKTDGHANWIEWLV